MSTHLIHTQALSFPAVASNIRSSIFFLIAIAASIALACYFMANAANASVEITVPMQDRLEYWIAETNDGIAIDHHAARTCCDPLSPIQQ
jgi:hypothetical protein